MTPGDKVETVSEFSIAPEEYRQAVEKIVISHAINEPVSYTHLTLPTILLV